MSGFHYDKKGYPRWNDSNRTVHSTTSVGRKRKPGQVTRHKDGNKSNFRNSNLTNQSRSSHSRYHARKKSSGWF